MLDHVICFKAPTLDEHQSKALYDQLSRLRDIPGVIEFAIGMNFGGRARGFDFCLRATLADRDALQVYQDHPLHLEVVKYNRAVTEEHICFDFEWEPGG